MFRYRPSLVVVGIIVLLVPIVAVLGADAEETVTAATLFARAETLYQQLRLVDPHCTDPAAWGTLALAFSEIPERFPTDPMAGEALWRVGDIHSRQLASGLQAAGEHAQAAYRRLVTRYPANEHAADAMLRLAELGHRDEARSTYFKLIERYPGSDSAHEARRRLMNRDKQTVAAAASVPEVAAPDSETFETTAKPLDEVLEAEPTPASGTASSTAGEGTAAAPATDAADTTTASADVAGTAMPPVVSAHVTGVRYYSDRTSTRVVIDMDRAVKYRMGEANDPPRLFVDLVGAAIRSHLPNKVEVAGIGVQQVRLGINRPGIVRAVLDLNGRAQYSLFTLTNPNRLVIDVAGPEMSRKLATARRPESSDSDGGAEARTLNLGVHRIVIDPGHGGSAPGAIGRSGATEKDLALDISKRLAANLRASNYDVVLTREGDTDVTLEDRPVRAIDADADLFVSIHVNSANNRSLSGFETYYLDLATDPTAAEVAARENAAARGGVGHLDDLLGDIVRNANKRESRDLAHSIQDSLVLQTSKSYDGIADLGVKHAPFVVLVGAEMPAVLVECSFLSNPTEEQRLRDESYRQELADAIHIGIENYAARRRMMTATR